MSLHININGRPVNAKLSKRELAEATRDEKRVEIVNRAVDSAEGYTSLGELSPKRNPDGKPSVTIPEDVLKYEITDLRERRKRGLPVKPVFYYDDPFTGETQYIFTDLDREAMNQGYICENCWGWQKEAITLDCKTIHNFECGYRKSV